jgi:hypothetical protein
VNIEDVTVATHNGKHAMSYLTYVREQLDEVKYGSVEDVLDQLQKIREDLLTGKQILGVISE